MLDSRTSLPTERAQRASAHGKGAGLLEALTARPLQPGDPSFGSVLSDTLSDRRASPASRERAAVARACAPAESRRSARRGAALPGADAEAGDEPLDASSNASPADRPDVQDAAPDDRLTDDADAPEPGDPSTMDGAQVTPNVAPAQDAAQQAAATPAVAGVLLSAVSAPASVEAGADDGSVATGQPSPSKAAAAGLTPLQWMAQQQVARLSAQTARVRAVLPVPAAETAAPVSAATALKGVAAPAATPTAQQALAPLVVLPAVPGALDALKASQEGVADVPENDPVAPVPVHGSQPQAHSATADPIGLLNLPEGSTYAAAPSQAAPSNHAATTSPAGAQPHGALPPTADEHAAANMQRLAAMVHARVGQGHSVARMQLQPPELGAVTAVVQLRQGKMDLRLEVASEAARDLVTDGLGRLRDSLQQQGISLDRATVNVAPRGEHASNDQQQPAWSGPQDQSAGQFHSGQGQEQGDRGLAASFAMDLPPAAGEGAGDLAAGVLYAAGLNVVA